MKIQSVLQNRTRHSTNEQLETPATPAKNRRVVLSDLTTTSKYSNLPPSSIKKESKYVQKDNDDASWPLLSTTFTERVQLMDFSPIDTPAGNLNSFDQLKTPSSHERKATTPGSVTALKNEIESLRSENESLRQQLEISDRNKGMLCQLTLSNEINRVSNASRKIKSSKYKTHNDKENYWRYLAVRFDVC